MPQGKPYIGRYLGYGSDWWAVWAAGARHIAFPLTVYRREILTRSVLRYGTQDNCKAPMTYIARALSGHELSMQAPPVRAYSWDNSTHFPAPDPRITNRGNNPILTKSTFTAIMIERHHWHAALSDHVPCQMFKPRNPSIPSFLPH